MSDKASGTLFADEPQTNRVGGYVARQMATFEREFESLIANFPNRIRRKEAFRHYVADRKKLGDQAPIRIAAAMANYLVDLERNPWRKVQNLRTWFNNWRDWEGPTKAASRPREETREDIIRRHQANMSAFIERNGDPDLDPMAREHFNIWSAPFVAMGDIYRDRWQRWKDACAEVGIDPKGRA